MECSINNSFLSSSSSSYSSHSSFPEAERRVYDAFRLCKECINLANCPHVVRHKSGDEVSGCDSRYYLFDELGFMFAQPPRRLEPVLDRFQLFRARVPLHLEPLLRLDLSLVTQNPQLWEAMKPMFLAPEHIGFKVDLSKKVQFSPSQLVGLFNTNISHHSFLIGVRAPYKPIYSFSDIIRMWFGLVPVSLIEAWCCVRTIITCIANESDRMRELERLVRMASASVYPVDFQPQLGNLKDISQVFSYYADQIRENLGDCSDLISSLVRKVLDAPKLLYDGLKTVIAGLVAEKIVDIASAKGAQFLSFCVSSVGICLFKTFIRHMLGYKWEHIVIEILFEKEFVLWALDRVASLSHELFGGALTPQMPDIGEFMKFAVALLVGVSGAQMSHGSQLVRNITQAAVMLDKFEFGENVKALYNYMMAIDPREQDMLRFKMTYPSTMNLVEAHQDIILKSVDAPPSAAVLRNLAVFYAGHLKELIKMNKEDLAIIRPLVTGAVQYVVHQGVSPKDTSRREPSHFVFAGKPGLGKSTVIARICDALAKHVKLPLTEAVYAVNPADQYASGYKFQDIWTFDELFQTVDQPTKPSIDIQLLFKLVTKTPIVLNMAAVEDKGMVARCNVILSGTNIPFHAKNSTVGTLSPYIKSVNDIRAIRGRLKYIVLPELQSGYKLEGRVIIDEKTGLAVSEENFDHGKLHHYFIKGYNEKLIVGPHGSTRFSFYQLLKFIVDDYDACRNYVERSYANDDLIRAGIIPDPSAELEEDLFVDQPQLEEVDLTFEDDKGKSEFLPQGFFDSLHKWWNPDVTVDGRLICRCVRDGCSLGGLVMANKICLTHLGLYLGVQNNGKSNYVFRRKLFDHPIEDFSSAVITETVPFTNYQRFTFNLEENMWVDTVENRNLCIVQPSTKITLEHFISHSQFTPVEHFFVLVAKNNRLPKSDIRGYDVLKISFETTAPLLVTHDVRMGETHPNLTLFTGLLVSASLGLVVGVVVKKLQDAALGYIFHDDKIVYYDAQSGEIFPDASTHPHSFITLNGRDYKRFYSHKTGKQEWYGQSGEQHFDKQVPSICNSLYALSTPVRPFLGNGFLLAESTMLMPLHCAQMLEGAETLTLRRDDVVKEALLLSGGEKRYLITPVPHATDLAIVSFLRSAIGMFTVSKARRHYSKIARSVPTQCAVVNYRRDRDGRLIKTESVCATSESPETYVAEDQTYVHQPSSSRVVNISSLSGWCGSIYLDPTGTVGPLLGMHVAGTGLGIGLFSTLHMLTEKMYTIPVSNVIDETKVVEDVAKYENFGEVLTISDRIFEPDNAKEKSRFYNDLKPAYEMSRVKLFRTIDGALVDPAREALRRLKNITLTNQKRPISLLPAATALGPIFATVYEQRSIPDYDEVVGGGDVISSIETSKSSGYPHNVPKEFFIVREGGRIIPSPLLLQMLEERELALTPEDFAIRPPEAFIDAPSMGKGCMKDEPVKLDKLDKKTRLFIGNEIVEVLVQRRYFYDLAINMVRQNTRFCSALGLSPDDFGFIHQSLAEVGPGGVVIAADFESMDMHVTEEDLIACLNFWLLARHRRSTGSVRQVDPALPPLDAEDFMRWRLVRRLAHFAMVIKNKAIAPGQMHPSGSFLTTIINISIQILAWSTAFSRVLRVPISEFFEQSRMVFLGDDSLIALPKQYASVDLSEVRKVMLDIGYVTTGDVKGECFTAKPLWQPSQELSDYTFLSRRFSSDGSKIVAPLEPSRCRKMICFVAKGKELQNMPQQMRAFAEELMRYRHLQHPDYEILYTEATEIFMRVFKTDVPNFLFLDSLTVASRYHEHVTLNARFKPQGGGDSSTSVALGANSSDAPTTFIEDVTTDSVTAQSDACEGWRAAGMEIENHAEARVFSRPFNFATFNWTVASAGVIHTSYHPSRYFQNNFNAQVKLANYAFFRGIMCIRAVMTSTPYTAGKLLMSVRPAMQPARTPIVASGDPCVELDAASGKSAVIKIPCVLPAGWVAVENFTNTIGSTFNTFFDWCTFSLSVISRLADPSSPVVVVQLYAWLEDVELKHPGVTNFTLAPQAGEPRNATEAIQARQAANVSSLPFCEEGGVVDTIEGVHQVVRTIGGVVVETSKIIGNVAASAALMGLSDPSIMDNTVLVATIPHFDAPHMYGKSPALVMAGDQTCKIVQPYGVFSLKTDCMNIRTYTSRMGLLGTFPWASSDVGGTEIGQLIINPGTLSNFNADIGYTPLSYAATLFRLWRGSIRYRFALAKTRFHAGVIEIVWQMGVTSSPMNDDAHATICYRFVWDIQNSESMEITCPYACPLPWQPTYQNTFRVTPIPNYNISRLTGKLLFRVVTPLVSPSGLASDAIDVVVYTAAGPDIEFAIPSLPGTSMFVPPTASITTPSSSKGKEKAGSHRFKPQGGESTGVFQNDQTSGVESVNPPLVMAPVTPTSPMGVISCIGEDIRNFRLLLRRFGRYHLASSIVTLNFYLYDMLAVPADQIRHAFFSALYCTYAFHSGGFRIAAVLTSGSCLVHTNYLGLNLLGLASVFVPAGSSERVFGIPWQSTVPFQYNRAIGSATSCPMSLYIESTSGTTSFMWSIATADDFTFGWQIGPDPDNLVAGVTLWTDDVVSQAPTFS